MPTRVTRVLHCGFVSQGIFKYNSGNCKHEQLRSNHGIHGDTVTGHAQPENFHRKNTAIHHDALKRRFLEKLTGAQLPTYSSFYETSYVHASPTMDHVPSYFNPAILTPYLFKSSVNAGSLPSLAGSKTNSMEHSHY